MSSEVMSHALDETYVRMLGWEYRELMPNGAVSDRHYRVSQNIALLCRFMSSEIPMEITSSVRAIHEDIEQLPTDCPQERRKSFAMYLSMQMIAGGLSGVSKESIRDQLHDWSIARAVEDQETCQLNLQPGRTQYFGLSSGQRGESAFEALLSRPSEQTQLLLPSLPHQDYFRRALSYDGVWISGLKPIKVEIKNGCIGLFGHDPEFKPTEDYDPGTRLISVCCDLSFSRSDGRQDVGHIIDMLHKEHIGEASLSDIAVLDEVYGQLTETLLFNRSRRGRKKQYIRP